MTNCWRLGCGLVSLLILAGCGGGTSSTSETSANSTASAKKTSIHFEESTDAVEELDVVIPASAKNTSVTKPVEDEESDTGIDEPAKDSPESFILEITQLKLKPLGDAKDKSAASLENQARLRRERNEKLVELATEAIARTHQDKSKERVFDLAVHHLLEAELQLAMAGDKEHIDAIYEHSSSLYRRDPKSKAAVEAGQTLITYARMNAQRFGQQEPKWLEEFARLSRQFAKNFPQEERQAIPMLFAAGQSCEFHGLREEALQCYSTIREQFPESPSVDRVTPILRRLNLKGKPLKLAGPTIGGGFINAEELVGKPLLVVFWTMQAQPFIRQLPTLQELLGQIDPQRLNVISVNLDDDDNESAVQTFLESNDLNWPTIFQNESGKRGWNNPIATYYGLQTVPMYWLASSKGNVVETANDVKQIETLLGKLMVPRGKPVDGQ